VNEKKIRLQVERVRTETVIVEVPIDVEEFEEWSIDASGDGWSHETVCEYLEADAEWPENIEHLVDGLTWTKSRDVDDEYTMQVVR
jgi:hypothetical protein